MRAIIENGSVMLPIFSHTPALKSSCECSLTVGNATGRARLSQPYSLRLNPTTDELQLIGDRTVRDAVAPMLRNYVTYVMPAIFPAASMRMGHDAVKTPFDLILLLLCE